MKSFVWFDGRFVASQKAGIPLLTHSLHYGSAVFEGIRCYRTKRGTAVFRLDDHIRRLFFSARTVGMKIPFSERAVADAVLLLINKNGLAEGYIRPIVFYGEKMGLSPIGAPLHIAIACWPWGKYLSKEAVSVKISRFARINPKSSVMEAKISGHYANSILATLEAQRAGYDEALLLDFQGNIAEGPGENIFFVRGNKLVTPPRGSILPGITRDSVIRVAKDLGITTQEKHIKIKDFRLYHEAFFTGTAAEINAIANIGAVTFNKGKEGPVTRAIKTAYLGAVKGELKKYKHWLAYC